MDITGFYILDRNEDALYWVCKKCHNVHALSTWYFNVCPYCEAEMINNEDVNLFEIKNGTLEPVEI